jgi:hypothetical protein
MSRCGYKGVSKNNYGKWQARISINNKSVALGSYDTPEEASKVYEAAVIHYRVQSYKYEAGSFLRAIKAPASGPEPSITPESEQPVVLTERPAVVPRREPESELQAVVREEALTLLKVVPPGCCPRCASPLYGPVGGDDRLCRQCGYQPRRGQVDAHGHRILRQDGVEEVFQPVGISRGQFEDEYWMDLHVGKGRGVLT